MKPNMTRTSVPRTGKIALVVLLLLQLFFTCEVDAIPYQRTLRLCSRSLSDALFLVCKGRGFNEPFSYSGEENDDEGRRTTSASGVRRPGLVQECCHRACSIEHLERYCKPLPPPAQQEDAASRGNAIGSKLPSATYKIVSLPYSSVKKFQVASVTRATIIPDRQIAGRAPRRKRRKKGRRKFARECGCRRQRKLRKTWRKVSRETVIPKVPAFQVGTTSPEPIDSIVIFPFKSELSLERIDGNVGPDREDFKRSR